MSTATKPEKAKKRPVEVIRRYIGGATIDVAIFDKKIEKKNGNTTTTRTTYFVAVSKSWRKRQEEGQDGPPEYDSGSVFNPHELLTLAEAVDTAYRRILVLQQGEQSDDGDEPF